MIRPPTRRVALAAGVATIAAAAAVAAGALHASDHQDTPLVEFDQRFDVNDVYAFPAASAGRVVLVLGTSSPLTPAGTPTATFGDRREVLYQLKLDNSGDGREDLVFQFTFSGPPGNQRVRMQGPERPNEIGTANTLLRGPRELQGATNAVLGSPQEVQLFAGARDDPFFIDLEQFFRIVPDRRPESGPLSQIPATPTAASFREAGSAVDYVRGLNDLAIVVELPIGMLTDDGLHPRFGVWGTTSRARRAGT